MFADFDSSGAIHDLLGVVIIEYPGFLWTVTTDRQTDYLIPCACCMVNLTRATIQYCTRMVIIALSVPEIQASDYNFVVSNI